jgi:hypothetical protein
MIRPTHPREYQHQSFAPADFHHQLPAFGNSMIAMFGGGFCAAFTGVLIARATGFDPATSNSNLLMWYSPLIWWAGLLLGFRLNWRARESRACWTWLSGALLLAFLAADLYWATRSWDHTRADIFPLWHAENSPEDQLGLIQLFFVWPAVNSFAYSLGAALPLVFGDRSHQNRVAHSSHPLA